MSQCIATATSQLLLSWDRLSVPVAATLVNTAASAVSGVTTLTYAYTVKNSDSNYGFHYFQFAGRNGFGWQYSSTLYQGFPHSYPEPNIDLRRRACKWSAEQFLGPGLYTRTRLGMMRLM